jgi:hypothetical protein
LLEPPPAGVVPYNRPLVDCTSGAPGCAPSAQPDKGQKLWSVVRVPDRVVWYSVPLTSLPPEEVVPYKLPSVAWMTPANGVSPSGQLTCKRYVLD